MCYPKPGPRCSTAGRVAYYRARNAYSDEPSENNYNLMNRARDAYLITTEGLEKLRTAAENADETQHKDKLMQLYEHYKKEREERIGLAMLRENSHKYNHAKAQKSLLDEGINTEDLTVDMIKARSDAQSVVMNVPGLIQLEKPGTQSAQYKRDTNGKITEVYYASYGSNLFADRFNVYISGGKVNGTTSYDGCRDKTLPSDDIRLALPGSIHYAGESYVWGGAPAFLDTSVRNTHSLGRAYRISTQQFEDVVAQESMTPVGEYQFDSERLIKDGHITTPGLYGKLEHVGDYNSAPVLTFTAPFTSAQARSGEYVVDKDGYLQHVDSSQVEALKTKREGVSREIAEGKQSRGAHVMKEYPVYTQQPSEAYLDTIANGMNEAHGLSKDEAYRYFNGSMGAYKAHWDRTDITRDI